MGFCLYFCIFFVAFYLRPGTDTHPTLRQENRTENGENFVQNVTVKDPCYLLKIHSWEDTVSNCCQRRIQDLPDRWWRQPLRLRQKPIITVSNSSCGKVMFLQVSVCPQGGGAHPSLGRHPPWHTLPLSRHPPGRQPLWADTSLGRHPHRQTPPWADTPLPLPPTPEMATAVDGTHPTGMHSFWQDFCWKLHENTVKEFVPLGDVCRAPLLGSANDFSRKVNSTWSCTKRSFPFVKFSEFS